jgi:Ca-activated chloride channel family protein
MTSLPNYYAILGVDPEATPEEVHAAAKRLGEKFPEDARDPSVNVAFRQLVEAYEVLSDPERRATYDEQLAVQSAEALDITIHTSRDAIEALDTEQLFYILIDVRAPTQTTRQRLPINLCLVFDHSTSMRGARLERVKSAARQVVEKLSPEDMLSVIGFSDRAKVVFPAGPIENRSSLISRINTMRASGGTEIFQGLQAGMEQLRQVPLQQYVDHLVLMTDGHTYGDEEQCLQLSTEAAADGVTFSAFGLGTDWNDRFLDELVAPSGGRSTYIEKAAHIVDYLEDQIQGLGAIYAKEVRLLNELPAAVKIRYLMKFSPFSQPLERRAEVISLGAVEGRAPLSILMELLIDCQQPGTAIKIPLPLVARIPSRETTELTFDEVVTVNVVAERPKQEPPAAVINAVQMLNLYRMNEQALQDLEAGRIEAATQRMERLATRLMEAGHTELAQDAMRETQRLYRAGTVSGEGRKKIKYGTRTLMSETIRFIEDGSV